MLESTFLGGKVRTRSLPQVQGPSGPETPVLKRLMLPQGELAQFYDDDDPVRYIACIQLLPGTLRGNHYHQWKEEWLYLVRGELNLVVQDIQSLAKASITLRAGDLAVVLPGIAHALQPLALGEGIEFSKTRFDPADSQRFPVLP